MSGIGKNRVFDKAALEELQQQTEKLLTSAQEVSETLQEEMQQLQELAGKVPAEAAHPAMSTRASELANRIKPEEFTTIQTAIKDNLEKLMTQIPMNDTLSAAALRTISTTTASMVSMAEELKAMIRKGNLNMSMEEFRNQIEDFESRWKGAAAAAELKMLAAATFMKGLVECSRFSCDPVNLSTGNLYYEKEDMKLKGILPLAFKRYYNAMDRGTSDLGTGWSHTHAETIRVTKDGELLLHKEDGKDITFRKKEKDGDIYQDIHNGKESIKETEEGYTYEEKKTRHTLTFDKEGRLQHRADRNGNRISYRYDEGGRVVRAALYPAQEQGGTPGSIPQEKIQPAAYLDFAYDENGFLRTVTDHTGRKTAYFPMDGRLSEVTNATGAVLTYRYTEDGKLRMVKNARGIMTLRNEYDEEGRITRQRFPDKGEMSYDYDDSKNTTTLTERNGAQIIYMQDERLRNIRTVYHDGSEERDTYDEHDNRTSHTDRNGNTTCYTYDDDNRITAVINALGQETALAYDGNGQPVSVKTAGKELIRNTYDEKGRLTESSDALGRTRKNVYDHRGLPAAIEAPDGSLTALTYDDRGNIRTITDPYGAVVTYEYDALGRITATTDPEGNRTIYAYDPMDRITSVTDPEGHSREYTYNESGKVTKIRDFDGNEESIEYNSLNRPERLTDKEGRQTIRHYDKMWNVSEEILPTGAVARYAYDKDNRLQRVELCENEKAQPGAVQENTYDPAGNLLQTKAGEYIQKEGQDTPEGIRAVNSVTYAYDALNRPVSVTDAEGNTTRYAYDAMGNLTKATDPAGNETSYTYNETGEMTGKTDPDGSTTAYTYNLLGQVETVTDPRGNTTTYEYAPGGRLLKTTYPGGTSLSYAYDADGRVKSRQHSNGYTLAYAYDSLGRITQVISSRGQKKTYAYDVMGNVTAATDANGNTTRYTYTMSGKLAAVTDPMGNTTEYSYDPMDNLTAVRQKGRDGEEDRTTVYERDPFGRVLCTRDAMGREEHFRYDALGRAVWKKDRDGGVTSTAYTMAGQPKSILYADGSTVEMQYDALQRLIRVKDSLGETRIKRDRTGRIKAVTDHSGQTVSYEWGAQGERKSTIYPGGQKTAYIYDNMQRLTAMQVWKQGAETPEETAYRYDSEGRLTEKDMPGGIRTIWQYNGEGLPESFTHEDREGILDRYEYAYDPMGNKTAVTRQRRGLPQESGIYTYAYDPVGRLTGVAKDNTSLRGYAYDTFSNRTRMEDHRKGSATAYTYDAANRLTMAQTQGIQPVLTKTYEYDNRGNLIKELEGGNPVHTYAYNAMNRLEKAWSHTPDGGIQAEAAYHYNGLGQRTGKTLYTGGADRKTGDVREDYLLDLTRPYHNLLSITRNDGTPVQTFYWDNNAAAMEETGELHYYLQDEMGSPIRVSGCGTGDGYLTYGYDEFGNDLAESTGRELEEAGIPNPYTTQGEGQPFGYTGYRYDTVSGTYFAQAREYQPKTGRFCAQDVIAGNGAAPETLNRYGYCLGNPVGLVDLDGREEQYVAAIYLLNQGTLPKKSESGVLGMGGAFGQGHAALILLKEDQNGYFFSYAGAVEPGAVGWTGSEGYLSTHLDDDANIQEISFKEFVEDNGTYADRVDSNLENHYELDRYTHGIYIPITDEEGIKMYDKALEIRNDPGQYNLWTHNCNQVAQTILAAGGKDFAPMEFDGLDTRPNAVYEKKTNEILKEHPEGWNYGSLDNLLVGILYNGDYIREINNVCVN